MVRRLLLVLMFLCTMGVSTNILASCSNTADTNLENTMDTTGDKKLFQAVEMNNLGLVQALLRGGTVNLEAKNSKGETPLMLATYRNYTKLALFLIAEGADVNAQDHNLNSPFLYAGAEGKLEIVQQALAHGADFTVFNRYEGTALIPAAEKGHLEVVQLLVNTPRFPIDHVNRLGWTALMEAIVLSEGGAVHTAIVAALIDGGVDVNIPDHDGKTPLYHAKSRSFTEMVKLLEAAGAEE